MIKRSAVPVIFIYCLLLSVVSPPGENMGCFAEPIIIKGSMVPDLLGLPLSELRVCSGDGRCIPFQVDECTADGEYICNQGKDPNSNSGNGLLDDQDEIVFLRKDCDFCPDTLSDYPASVGGKNVIVHTLIINEHEKCRRIYCTNDTGIHLSDKKYIYYDHEKQYLETTHYYAQFGKDQFHFLRAGLLNSGNNTWVHLCRELRVELMLKAFWGLLPIHYTENNLVCYVRRYKVGPVRLIRRGDFHLRIGLGVKGSRAAVNQICYPELVQVPVNVHVPFRLGTLFKEAWMEMAPIIDSAGIPFSFSIPECGYSRLPSDTGIVDTLIPCNPDNNLFTIIRDNLGIGWVLTTNIPHKMTDGSGFISRKPSPRGSPAEYGFRLQLKDLPSGYYLLTIWVLFTEQSQPALDRTFEAITHPAMIDNGKKTATNRIYASVIKHKK
jgi:hypothetical protein